jgi:hypothetical protein
MKHVSFRRSASPDETIDSVFEFNRSNILSQKRIALNVRQNQHIRGEYSQGLIL